MTAIIPSALFARQMARIEDEAVSLEQRVYGPFGPGKGMPLEPEGRKLALARLNELYQQMGRVIDFHLPGLHPHTTPTKTDGEGE